LATPVGIDVIEPESMAGPAGHPDVATLVRWFDTIDRTDTSTVGGKGANLGELTRAGLPVPPGFVVTVDAYDQFLTANDLGNRIDALLNEMDVNDPAALQSTAESLRKLVLTADVPDKLRSSIQAAYRELGARQGASPVRVAVRSSATAEDTGQFSFAGMFESFLNVQGDEELIHVVRKCWASTFSARVLFYRVKQGLPRAMAVGVVVQVMVDSEKSGVLFTVDPTSADKQRMVIEAAWGLGEVVVLGQVSPDRYVVEKTNLQLIEKVVGQKAFLLTRDPLTGENVRVDLAADPRSRAQVLSDDEVSGLGDLGRRVEQYYGTPQDIEFAIAAGKIYLTQSRPITTLAAPTTDSVETVLVRGIGASPGTASGLARLIAKADQQSALAKSEILVTAMTSPDWVPMMRRAAGIVTDAGGMTSHASIVSRELGIPCIVGTGTATATLKDGMLITVDGASGVVTAGGQPARAQLQPAPAAAPSHLPARAITATRLYVNLGEPDRADAVAALDVDGVGLLRAEFMLLQALDNTHPQLFLREGRGPEFVERMATGLRTIAKAFHPRPVVYRATDFRSNEFRNLTGGQDVEPVEDNPMIGYRGCFRYVVDPALFELELEALHLVRQELPNLHLMIPFVRTLHELKRCRAIIDASTLGADRDLRLWVMAEVPSVAYWLKEYAKLGISGISIGSNDLTQLILGVDRDSTILAPVFDERDPAVLDAIRTIITRSRRLGLTTSICGHRRCTRIR
jgi:pyruvate,water dikinase